MEQELMMHGYMDPREAVSFRRIATVEHAVTAIVCLDLRDG